MKDVKLCAVILFSFLFLFLIYYKVFVLRGIWNLIKKEKMNTWKI